MSRHALMVLAAAALVWPLAAQQGEGLVSGAAASYSLRPGDILAIKVWGQDDFSGRFQVDENWSIHYPVLGEINLRDMTVGQVRERLREGLQEIFRTPFVTVTPLFRMAVLGEVRAAGLYTVDPTLSVIDVVALAGGPTAAGNMKKIRLLRAGGETRLDFEREALAGRTLAEIGIRSGDEIVVPRKWFTREDILILVGIVQILLSVAIFINTT